MQTGFRQLGVKSSYDGGGHTCKVFDQGGQAQVRQGRHQSQGPAGILRDEPPLHLSSSGSKLITSHCGKGLEFFVFLFNKQRQVTINDQVATFESAASCHLQSKSY